MSTHAKYSPSQLSRILSCPASASAPKDSSSSSYAEEGTMLHEVVERGLFSHSKGESWALELKKHSLTPDQYSAVEECILYALDLMTELGEYTMWLEKRVYAYDDCDGTADLILFNDKEVHVIDWKFGAGIEVSAYENIQLMTYGVGALRELGKEGNYHLPVMIHVVQPRLNNFDTYCTSAGNLERWLQHTLIPGIELAKSPDAPYHPSVEACRWCPIKSNCTSRVTMAFKHAEDVFEEYAKMPEIPAEKIAELITKAEEVEACIKDLKLHATKLLLDGKEVPGLKMVRGRSNRVWVDVEAAGEFLSSILDPEEMFTMKMVSPAQAEKLLDRDLRKDDSFLSLIDKPEGKATLVPESDKRQAISGGAECVFQNFTKE